MSKTKREMISDLEILAEEMIIQAESVSELDLVRAVSVYRTLAGNANVLRQLIALFKVKDRS